MRCGGGRDSVNFNCRCRYCITNGHTLRPAFTALTASQVSILGGEAETKTEQTR